MNNLVIVIGAYPDLFYRTGGLQIQISETYNHLKELGHEVYYTHEWLKVKKPIDIYHQFSLETSLYKLFWENKKYAKKIVLSPIFQHNSLIKEKLIKTANYFPFYEFVLYKHIKSMAKNSDGYIFLGRAEKKQFESYFDINTPIPSELISNGLNIDFSKISNNKSNYIVNVGSICERKNQLTLIKICRGLQIPLKIIGPRDDEVYYQKCVAAIKGADVEFLGKISNQNDQFVKLLSEARLFVLPSKSEVLPISVFEAIACGTKVICTENCSVKDYLNGPYIKYVNPGNIIKLKKYINDAFRDNIEIPVDDVKNVRNLYTWDTIAKDISNFYNRLLKA